MRGVTLDTGALIAIERRKPRAIEFLELAKERQVFLTTSVAVIAEWWRGRSDVRERILDVMNIEPVTLPVAMSAGEALAKIPQVGAMDALVMATAARRGDAVLTSDVDDLERLRSFFPTVRVLGV